MLSSYTRWPNLIRYCFVGSQRSCLISDRHDPYTRAARKNSENMRQDGDDSEAESKAVVGADLEVDNPTLELKALRRLHQDINIIATYSDTAGAVRLSRVKMSDLSPSWVLENPADKNHDQPKVSQRLEDSSKVGDTHEDHVQHSVSDHRYGDCGTTSSLKLPLSPVMLQRQIMRKERREHRTSMLIQDEGTADNQTQAAAFIWHSSLDTSIKGKHSIWGRYFDSPNSDSTLKLMRDQIIMAKAYANIAKSNNVTTLYSALVKQLRENRNAIGEAMSNAKLLPRALVHAKAMGSVLSMAKDRLYECPTISRKLRVMLQLSLENVKAMKKKSAFLINLAAKTIPKPLHCLPLQLAADYFLYGHQNKEYFDRGKVEDPSLFHYAIFSDNVLATSVVVKSTVQHAKYPEEHVFHIVTDKLNFAAMKMWFIANPPAKATVQVENIDDFKWVNASYCSVLRQLESTRIKEYYFKENHPSSLASGADNLKYRNPKYLSMMNHLRFYLPEVYPKLDKILFLDDDIVVQKDLTPLWSVDLHGMVNGAVETCKKNFHSGRGGILLVYIIIGRDLNEDRTLWKLGTLPPGLITFYNLTYPLDRSWHVLGLGYDPALNQTAIKKAAVVHYNGNYKPWLDVAISKYKSYWSRYLHGQDKKDGLGKEDELGQAGLGYRDACPKKPTTEMTMLFLLLLFSCSLTSGIGYGAKHEKEYCAMYDICGSRSDGKVLNCPFPTSSVKPDDYFSAKIQSLCPAISGNVCCTETQFDTLRAQVQQAIPLLVGCPACLRNFLNLFCELSCSPNQSLFINVTSISEVNGNLTVDGIAYYIFVGGGANNFKEWFAFIGQKAPLAPACSSSEPPSPPKKESCLIRIGPLKVKCLDFSVAILYIILVFAFLGWASLKRTRERRAATSTEPLLRSMDEGEADSTEIQKDGKVPQLINRFQLVGVQGHMSSFYRNYGKWVARNPTLVLCSSVAVVLVLCIGLICFKVETRPEKLWVGPGSKAAEEKHFLTATLPPSTELNSEEKLKKKSITIRMPLILATLPDSKDGKRHSIVTDENIQLLFEIQKKVDGIRANYSGSVVSLTDICLKPLGNDCATQSLLQYFKMDAENYDDYGGVEHAEYCFQHYTTADTCMSAFKAPLDPSTALGGFSGNNYSEASAFVVTYPVNNAIDEASNGKAVAWEKAFIRLVEEELLSMVQPSNLTLSYSSESSIEEELKRESTADIITIAVSYVVMFAYVSVTLGDASRLSTFFLSSKVLLGLSGVVLVMLSVLGSVGFFSAFGVKSTLIIMEVIPFLVLAVGVDNMCILVHAVKRQSIELPIEERISNALLEVGPSITLASLSEILAFAVGSFIPMPACRVFSMFAALAVLLDFLLQVTAFVALITFDCRRAEDNRIDCFPCIKVPSSTGGSNEGINQRRTGLLARYMKEVHAPILGVWAVKIVVIAIFVAFALASIALCPRIESGLEQQVVLPRDSYLQGYFNNISEYLRIGPPLYFVVKDYNYSLESRHTNQLCSISQCDSNSLLNEVSRASLVPESSYIAKPAASWLDDFLVWLSPEAFGCCRKFMNGTYCPPDDQPPCCSPDDFSCGFGGVCKDCTTCFRHSDLVNDRPSTMQFTEKLPWFLDALPSSDCAKGGHGAYTSSVDLNGYKNGVIRASEFRTYHTPVNKQGDYVNALRAAREFSSRISDSLKIEIFPYSVFYIFFEQYLDIWRIALINIAIALGAIFIVCLVITSSFWCSAIILLVLVMIVVDLMGVMAVLDIQLNAISVVNLIMSIGIAVEFCVHIAHAFLVSHGDRGQRAKEALGTMGASVFSGITLTKLVGVIVLCFARSEVFVVYYFQMYLALVIIGFLHGLVFLPVVLSVVGPPPRHVIMETR
ncbi:PATCHED FAMILY PROTEIN [Salix purpurea]|uniref:PATCHED FAMILY PROTEIN n=1 Tax=Salix purpurea TaxID=77065 RepID=A0A9Q1A6S9_SALPP|nr:PATCHED FAMILY PROTEIN [Salix purpurea]